MLQPSNPAVIAQRENNKKTVERYFQLEGPDQVEQRLELFCEDGMLEVMFNPDGKVDRVTDHKFLRERFATIKRFWKEFRYKDVTVLGTADPDVFAVECYSEALMDSPYFFQPHPYDSLEYYLFFMRDAKIKCLRQFSNPNMLHHAFWKIVPDKTI